MKPFTDDLGTGDDKAMTSVSSLVMSATLGPVNHRSLGIFISQ